MQLDQDGAQHFAAVLDEAMLADLEAAIASQQVPRAGVRLFGQPYLRGLLAADGVIGRLAASCLGKSGQPVRAILFDRSAAANWALGWHQDRTIAVTERVDLPGYESWSVKGGVLHVAPPFDLLERMVTLRIHLDPVDIRNAPLLVAPGSHRLGLVREADIPTAVARRGTVACLAARGDVWAYVTPILHASEAASRPARRRVLQVDFSADGLPGGLEWRGV